MCNHLKLKENERIINILSELGEEGREWKERRGNGKKGGEQKRSRSMNKGKGRKEREERERKQMEGEGRKVMKRKVN